MLTKYDSDTGPAWYWSCFLVNNYNLNISSDYIMTSALRCPFLSRIPVSQVKTAAPQLMNYADRCPIMVHAMRYMSVGSATLEKGNCCVP